MLMASLTSCSDISPKLLLMMMPTILTTGHLVTSLSDWYFHVDLDRVDIGKHLAPPNCKPVSEITLVSMHDTHDLWQESHIEIPCRARLGNKNEGKWLEMGS